MPGALIPQAPARPGSLEHGALSREPEEELEQPFPARSGVKPGWKGGTGTKNRSQRRPQPAEEAGQGQGGLKDDRNSWDLPPCCPWGGWLTPTAGIWGAGRTS